MANLSEDVRATAVDLGDLLRFSTAPNDDVCRLHSRCVLESGIKLLLDRLVFHLLHCTADPIRVRCVVANDSS